MLDKLKDHRFDYKKYIEEKIKSLESLRAENINIYEKRRVIMSHTSNENFEIKRKLKIPNIKNNLESFQISCKRNNPNTMTPNETFEIKCELEICHDRLSTITMN